MGNTVRVLLVTFMFVFTTLGDAIPSARLPQGGLWQPGVPGGIPNTYTQWCDVTVSIPGTTNLAVGDGVTDDTVALNYAWQNCPSNAYVYLPAGTYFTSTGIRAAYGAHNVILRGAGPTQTRITSASASSILTIRSQFGPSIPAYLASDAHAGDTNITLTDASSYNVVGRYIQLMKTNDPSVLSYGATASYEAFCESQLVHVTSKSGNTLGLDRPLYLDFPTNRYAQVQRPSGTAMPMNCGIEDLAVERTAASGSHNIYFYLASECWVKNVESIKANKWHFRGERSVRCEVRDSYFHDGWNGGGDSSYGSGWYALGTENLTENCAFDTLRHSMILEYGGVGNVFGYNYSFNPVNENGTNTDYLMGDQITHGGIPVLNLWEGNIAATIRFDNVLGGSATNTVFRSLVQRKGYPATYLACYGMDIQRANLYANIVGSVFEDKPTNSSNGLTRYGSTGDNITNPDSNVTNTIYLHGYVTLYDGPTVTWASTNADHVLPSSYYLSSQPSWWTNWSTTSPWPPIGPDISGYTNTIPAVNMLAQWYDSAGTNLPPTITTQPTSQTITSGTTATLTVTATGDEPLTYQWYAGASGDTSTPQPGATGSSLTTPVLTTTATYWVQVTNGIGTADSTAATITITTPIPATVKIRPRRR